MRLVLLGDPVAHSRSPAIMAAALEAAGIAGMYEARRVDGAGVGTAVAELRGGVLDGANITMPHKARAAALADRAAHEVEMTGVANTLVLVDGEVEAHNTDVGGIRDICSERGLPEDAAVLILGAGGAAAAAAVALRRRTRVVAARRPDAAVRMSDRLGGEISQIPWGVPQPGAVVVNATPLGMHGEELPPGLVEGASGLVDLAYGDDPTPAVVLARSNGIPVADGLDHLVAQAARSFTIWTGLAAPRAIMARTAR